MQYELRPDQNGVPRVQMVGEKLDIGSITYKMQDNADALVRVKYGDSHDLKGAHSSNLAINFGSLCRDAVDRKALFILLLSGVPSVLKAPDMMERNSRRT